jgi:hypothetical protein
MVAPLPTFSDSALRVTLSSERRNLETSDSGACMLEVEEVWLNVYS